MKAVNVCQSVQRSTDQIVSKCAHLAQQTNSVTASCYHVLVIPTVIVQNCPLSSSEEIQSKTLTRSLNVSSLVKQFVSTLMGSLPQGWDPH